MRDSVRQSEMTEEVRVFVGATYLNRYHSLLRYCNSTDPFSETKCESPSAGYERFSWRAIFAGIEESSSREEDSRRNHFGNYPPPFHPFLPLERLPSLTAAPLIVDIVLTVLKPSAARARLSSRNLLLESAFYPRVSEVRWEIIVTREGKTSRFARECHRCRLPVDWIASLVDFFFSDDSTVNVSKEVLRRAIHLSRGI